MLTRDMGACTAGARPAAGYLSRGDITANRRGATTALSPTFSPHIDRLIQLGKLSPDVVRKLLRETGEPAELPNAAAPVCA